MIVDRPPKGWHDYLCSYQFEGRQYSLTLRARNWDEAEARLKALFWGTVDGELHETIPAVPTAKTMVRILVWWRNLRSRPGA